MGDIMIEYKDINLPEELYFYMRTIKYGYLTKDRIIIPEKKAICNSYWYNNYILQDTNDLIITKTGNCFDQTEFARTWFINHNYEVKTYHIQGNKGIKKSHSFIVYKDKFNKNSWNWFEMAWKSHEGIHSYSSLKRLLKHHSQLYKEELNTDNIRTITIWEFPPPNRHSTINNYINNLNKGKKLILKENR